MEIALLWGENEGHGAMGSPVDARTASNGQHELRWLKDECALEGNVTKAKVSKWTAQAVM
jgi:hypothetical protein